MNDYEMMSENYKILMQRGEIEKEPRFFSPRCNQRRTG